jgi:hypothetical protein
MSTSANSPQAESRAAQVAIRAGFAALIIEGALWSAIRFFSFLYELAGEANLSQEAQRAGWVRLAAVGVTVAGGVILFLAAARLRDRAGPAARVAQVLAVAINVVVLARGVAAALRFSGAQAVVVAVFVMGLAAASLAGLGVALRAAIADRPRRSSTGAA